MADEFSMLRWDMESFVLQEKRWCPLSFAYRERNANFFTQKQTNAAASYYAPAIPTYIGFAI